MSTLLTQEADWKFRELTYPGAVLNHSLMRFGARIFLRLTHAPGRTVKHVFYGGFQGRPGGLGFNSPCGELLNSLIGYLLFPDSLPGMFSLPPK